MERAADRAAGWGERQPGDQVHHVEPGPGQNVAQLSRAAPERAVREDRQGLRAVQGQQFGADGRSDDAEQPDRPAAGLRVAAPLRGPRALQRLERAERAERPVRGGETAGDPPVDGRGR